MAKNSFLVYDPKGDSKFSKLYGANTAKANLEASEAYLLKDGTTYMLVMYADSCDAAEKKGNYNWKFEAGFYSAQIDTEGEKGNPFLKWFCTHIEKEMGLGKENPFSLMVQFNSLNEQVLGML